MLVRSHAPARAHFPFSALGLTVAALLASVGLGACSDEKAPDTTAPSGFVVVRDADAGFAIAVPAEWERVPLPDDLDDFDRRAAALSARNPNLGPAIVQARQLLQFGGRLMAVSTDGLSVLNLTVDKAPEKTLEEVGRETTAKLQEAGASGIAQEQATTGAGPALKLTFNLRVEATGGTTREAAETQYYLLRDGKSYVITLQNGTPEIASAVAASLRIR